MKDTLLCTYVAFKSMPLILRLITIFCSAGLFFMAGPFMPFGNFEINGESVSQEIFWRSGAGPAMISTGLLMMIVAFAIMKRKRWARLALIGLVPSAYLVQSAFMGDWSDLEALIVSIVIISVPLAFYLYRRATARAYFDA